VSTAAVIVAAGRGLRAGGGLAKQFRPLAGARAVDLSLQCFAAHPAIDRIVLVLPPYEIAGFADYVLAKSLILTEGGADRSTSVLNGLRVLSANPPKNVLIHDVARPCVRPDTIDRVITALKTHQAAAPALPVTDALWRGGNDLVIGTQDRRDLFRAQTPQGFHFKVILAAHQSHIGAAADDVEVARNAGIAVAIVPGDEDNIKITTPGDFVRAERILRKTMDIRTGNGFDVHAFETGDKVVLCGVEIPHTAALKGHSDADVAMHALTDAIYGGLGQGDIGQWFPPSDPQWQGAASSVFLAHATEIALKSGFVITHVDVTIICELPKIGPHAGVMKARLAEILAIDVTRVSVKATTSEGLGFTGRREGIAAMATATLVKA
jgi:2-C-methyl-D-erythritol 4-phosphate cytidylyltransferase / 2-C-methyl-D-erythritol 2,4-cyclodiphosphate synthase